MCVVRGKHKKDRKDRGTSTGKLIAMSPVITVSIKELSKAMSYQVLKWAFLQFPAQLTLPPTAISGKLTPFTMSTLGWVTAD